MPNGTADLEKKRLYGETLDEAKARLAREAEIARYAEAKQAQRLTKKGDRKEMRTAERQVERQLGFRGRVKRFLQGNPELARQREALKKERTALYRQGIRRGIRVSVYQAGYKRGRQMGKAQAQAPVAYYLPGADIYLGGPERISRATPRQTRRKYARATPTRHRPDYVPAYGLTGELLSFSPPPSGATRHSTKRTSRGETVDSLLGW